MKVSYACRNNLTLNKKLKILCYYTLILYILWLASFNYVKKDGIISKAYSSSISFKIEKTVFHLFMISDGRTLRAIIPAGHWEFNGKTRCYSSYEGIGKNLSEIRAYLSEVLSGLSLLLLFFREESGTNEIEQRRYDGDDTRGCTWRKSD